MTSQATVAPVCRVLEPTKRRSRILTVSGSCRMFRLFIECISSRLVAMPREDLGGPDRR